MAGEKKQLTACISFWSGAGFSLSAWSCWLTSIHMLILEVVNFSTSIASPSKTQYSAAVVSPFLLFSTFCQFENAFQFHDAWTKRNGPKVLVKKSGSIDLHETYSMFIFLSPVKLSFWKCMIYMITFVATSAICWFCISSPVVLEGSEENLSRA